MLLVFLNTKYGNFLRESGYLKNDINSLYKEFKKISLEENEDCYSYVKNEEKSNTEKILNK